MNELSRNLVENKEPLWKTSWPSRNVCENTGIYPIKAGMLQKIKGLMLVTARGEWRLETMFPGHRLGMRQRGQWTRAADLKNIGATPLTVMLSESKHPPSLSLVPNQKTTGEILRPDKSGLRMTRDFKLRFRVQENSFFERTKLESH